MSKDLEKEKVIRLRKQGLAYSQIREQIPVSKSTLSRWLLDMPLSKSRIDELRGKSPKRIERFRMTMKSKRDFRFEKVSNKEKSKIGKISKRDLYLIGIALYWAEGTKVWGSQSELTNSDPMLVKTFLKWLIQEGVIFGKIKIRLHIYADMNQAEEVNFWSQTLNIPKNQFSKVTIKESLKKDISYKRGHGHGTCQIIYGECLLNDRIRASIEQLRFLVS